MILKNAEFYEKLTACFGSLAEFERKICQLAEVVGIDLAEFEIDHLAVRVNSVEKAQAWKSVVLTQSSLLKESEVNGRPIALLSFHQPLLFCYQAVSVLELPFPKGKTYPMEGWEHIEIVVPMLEQESVNAWVERLCKRWDLNENPQIQLKISEPFVEGERLPNPSIAIALAEKSANPCTIKLHPYAIQKICQES